MSVESQKPKGPLSGVVVVEFAGIGPGPFCAMLLGDLGARIVRIDRVRPEGEALSPEAIKGFRSDVMGRSKWSIALDLKSAESRTVIEALVARSDVLLEGYRPGVMERLGYGPTEMHAINSAIVYGRMTGWGQSGPLAQRAGHDLNYISVAGVLSMLGPSEGAPAIPLNLIADFGGGGMYMAFAIAAALVGVRQSGRGVVIDASMTEGAQTLASMIFGMRSTGAWVDQRGSNLLDGGAPFYSIYRCADGGFMSVAALEAKFFTELISRLGVEADPAFANQYDKGTWAAMRSGFETIFASQPRSYFEELLDAGDTCVTAVLSAQEAIAHPHNRERSSFMDLAGVIQPSPGPLFDGQRPGEVSAPPYPDEHRSEVLEFLGLS